MMVCGQCVQFPGNGKMCSKKKKIVDYGLCCDGCGAVRCMVDQGRYGKETERQNDFGRAWRWISIIVKQINEKHGYGDIPNDEPLAIALMHSELSEMLEAFRDGNPPSKKLWGAFDCMTEELADLIIRAIHFAVVRKMPVVGAIIEKLRVNERREFRHGRKVT